MAIEEKAFPRGGAPVFSNTKKSNLFDQKKKKIKNKKKVKHQAVTGSDPKLISLDDLSYKTLTEGMIVLGRVTEITDYYLHVSLPGLISGRVPVTQISEPYSQLLQSMSQSDDNIEALCPLSELFYKGQLVLAQVWQIRKTSDNRHVITLSLDPRVLYTAWSHAAMAKKGLIITAAVKSKEEHGYVMDCGVNGLRSFLKDDKVQSYCDTFNSGRPLAVGQLVRTVVVKGEPSPAASKVELSADPDDVCKHEINGSQPVDMQHIMPGMRFKLSVADSMRDGVMVNFMSSSGYLHRNHIPISSSAKEAMPHLEHGSSIFGRVLYITPIVKHVFFSALPCVSDPLMEIPKPSPAETNFGIGDTVNSAKVTGVSGKGIFLNLGKKNSKVRGFVPERRIGFNFKGKVEDDANSATMLQRLRDKYPLGSTVRCRLIHYDSMIETYVCSMEKSVLNEKYLTFSDVQVSSVVPCVVDQIRDGGIVVRVGMLNGFVPAAHSADVPLHQPAKKYNPGLRVTGRVLKVDLDKHKLIITLKNSLVTSQDPIIMSCQSARKGTCYTGTVVAISSKGAIVSFFGDAKGFLENSEHCVPTGHKFFLGQLVRCYVLRRNDNQLKLTLIPPSQSFKLDQAACKTVLVGQAYTLEVLSVENDGLQVKITDEGESYNATGVIPIFQLSDNLDMCKLLLATFEIGTVLTNVWCFSNGKGKEPVVFSMRSSVTQFFKGTHGKIASKKLLEAVCPGWILPCSVQKIHPSYLLLQVPLASVSGLVKVSRELVCEQDEDILSIGLVEGQGIQAKVLKVIAEKNTLLLGCRKSELWDGELETCVLYLSKYLSDQERLQEYAKKAGSPLGAFNVGGKVSGVVSEKTDWGFVLKLTNGARGEVTFFNAESDDLDVGTRVNGKILNIDFLRGHVELSIRKEVCASIHERSSETGLFIDPDVQLRGPTLLVTPEFILIRLKGENKPCLAYIPTYLYPHGKSILSAPEPFFGIDRKVIVKRCSNGIVICLPKEVVENRKKIIKQKEKIEKKKTVKKERYFQIMAPEDIKKEDEDDELESAKRVLDTQNDIKIIDAEMDEISDQESVDVSDDSDSDSPDNLEKKSDDEKENVTQNSSKLGKRKLSNVGQDLELSENSKVKKKKNKELSLNESNDPEVEEVTIKKKRKDACLEALQDDGPSGLGPQAKKKKKKVIEVDLESIDDSACGDNLVSSNGKKPTLENPGFMWDIDPTKFMEVLEPTKDNSSSDDDSDEDQNPKKKKSKKSAAERREATRLEEERLQKVERELLDPNRQLSSCDDFDRTVLANPDNSAIWLRYMAFHLQATEIEKARAVAHRAIKSISYREEQEKLNVWLGLLNLENLYGTPDSLKTTLDQALQSNDPYKIRTHMVRLYAENGKNRELESEVRLVVKKFKETPGMWLDIGTVLMTCGYTDKARTILQQALPHMRSKKESVDLVVQFALMEARNNNMEQAKALMDPILASYPKRLDVWIVYCDMLVRAKEIAEARELLERAVSQKMPSQKMKTLFTKYLQFEEVHGSTEGQEKVRKMAADYVKQVSGEDTKEDI